MCQLLTDNKGLDHEQRGCSWANALVPGHHQLPLLWSLRVRVKDPEFSATCHWLEISLIYWRQIANQLPQGNVFFDCKLKSVNSKLDSRRYRNPELAVIIFMMLLKTPFPICTVTWTFFLQVHLFTLSFIRVSISAPLLPSNFRTNSCRRHQTFFNIVMSKQWSCDLGFYSGDNTKSG